MPKDVSFDYWNGQFYFPELIEVGRKKRSFTSLPGPLVSESDRKRLIQVIEERLRAPYRILEERPKLELEPYAVLGFSSWEEYDDKVVHFLVVFYHDKGCGIDYGGRRLEFKAAIEGRRPEDVVDWLLSNLEEFKVLIEDDFMAYDEDEDETTDLGEYDAYGGFDKEG